MARLSVARISRSAPTAGRERGVTRVAALALAAALCAVTPPAAAQNGESDALMRRGVTLRRRGRDAAALGLFRAAWELSRLPRARAQMGLAAQELRAWVDAERWLTEALAETADPWVQQWSAQLTEALRQVRAQLCRVTVDVPAGVTARIRGADLSAGSSYLAPGDVEVEFRRGDEAPDRIAVTLPAGGEITVRPPPPPVVEAPPTPPAVVEVPTPPVVAVAPPPVVEVTPPATRRVRRRVSSPVATVGWTLLAGAAASAVVGTVGVVLQRGAAGEYNDDPRCGPSGSANQPASCVGLERDASAGSTVAYAGFATAGALALGGALMVLLAPRAVTTSRVACAPVGPGVRCGWTF